MEKYFDEGTLYDEEIAKGLEIGLRTGKVVPVLCGSAMKMVGVDTLLDFIVSSVPSPAAVPPVEGDTNGAKRSASPMIRSARWSSRRWRTRMSAS